MSDPLLIRFFFFVATLKEFDSGGYCWQCLETPFGSPLESRQGTHSVILSCVTSTY